MCPAERMAAVATRVTLAIGKVCKGKKAWGAETNYAVYMLKKFNRAGNTNNKPTFTARYRSKTTH
jgi:hypothetical protein